MNRFAQSRNPNSRIGWYSSQKKHFKEEEEDTEQKKIDSINQPQGVVGAGGLTPEALGIKPKKKGRPKYITFKV